MKNRFAFLGTIGLLFALLNGCASGQYGQTESGFGYRVPLSSRKEKQRLDVRTLVPKEQLETLLNPDEYGRHPNPAADRLESDENQ